MEEQIQHQVDKILAYMREEAYKPLTVKELEEVFQVEGSEEFKDFVKALVQMEEMGLVVRTRSNRYGVPEKMNLVRGVLTGHAKGFAFLIPDEAGMDDVFIPLMRKMGRCMAIMSLSEYHLPVLVPGERVLLSAS